MFRFRTISFIFLGILFLLIGGDYIFDYSNIIYAVPTVIYFGVLTWASFNISSNFYLRSYNSIETNEKLISITFDDGPHTVYTSQILAVLKKHNVRASFFCVGKSVEQYPKIVQDVLADGHEVGLHSYSHSYLYDFYTVPMLRRDLKMNQHAILEATGLATHLYRPPYGVTNPAIGRMAKLDHLHVVGWSIRSLDTISSNRNKVISRIMSKLKPGHVILLHDHLPITVDILEELLIKIIDSGYQFVKIGDSLKKNIK